MIFGDMFNGCKSLCSIDISNFNFKNAYVKDSMFDDCICLPENFRNQFE